MGDLLRGRVLEERQDAKGFSFKLIESDGKQFRFDTRVKGDPYNSVPVNADILFRTANTNSGREYACWIELLGAVPKTEERDASSAEEIPPLNPAPMHAASMMQKNQRPMFEWAYFPYFNSLLDKLRNIALREKWHFGPEPNGFPLILRNYLHYTFERLHYENKVMVNEKHAAFDTGLVDRKYDRIYCVFNKNPNPKVLQDWVFWDFAVAGEEWTGKELVRQFNPLPQRAKYFEKTADCIYESTEMPQCDFPHILLERIERLPYQFISDNCPGGFNLMRTEKMDSKARKTYCELLTKEIQDNPKILRNMVNRLKDSVALALKRVEWNYKTAIPMYYPTLQRMSLLLPIALVDDEKVDVALVAEKTDSGAYLGHTILTLDMAYSNARLITRPDSDWLVTDVAVSGDEFD